VAVFTVRVTGAKKIRAELDRRRKRTADGSTRRIQLVAADLLRRSRALAPIWRGDLIASSQVRRTGRGSVKGTTVEYGTGHAVFAHETVSATGQLGISAGGSTKFGIGRRTAQKPRTEDGPPGGKFLSRPLRRHGRRYQRFILEGGKSDVEGEPGLGGL
jgi:hypothetical protein